jgi:hypothetical protein
VTDQRTGIERKAAPESLRVSQRVQGAMKTKKMCADGRSIQCITAKDFESRMAHTVDIAVGQMGIIMAENGRKKEAARIYGDLAQVS